MHDMQEDEAGTVVGLLFAATLAAVPALFGAPSWVAPLLILVAAGRCYFAWTKDDVQNSDQQ